MSNEIKVPIPSRVYNAATGGHVTGAEDIDFGQKVKHLVKYDHSGNEVSFASQLSAQNTIYVIHDDFTLGEDITIPENCVLEFDGGSISGEHTITGQNTGIKAGLVKIFNTDVTLAGTWNVAEAYPEWFGAKGDGVTDDTTALQKTFDSFSRVKLTKNYMINTCTISRDGAYIFGGGIVKSNSNGAALTELPWIGILNVLEDNVIIDNIHIEGNFASNSETLIIGVSASGTADNTQTDGNGEYVVTKRLNNVSVSNCEIENVHTAILIDIAQNVHIINNVIDSVSYCGISFLSVLDGDVTGNKINDVNLSGANVNSYGVGVSKHYNYPNSQRVIVSGNTVKNNPYWEAYDTHDGIDITFSDNIANNCQDGVVATSTGMVGCVQHIVITNNRLYGNKRSQSIGGISLTGYSSGFLVAKDNVIANNSIENFYKGIHTYLTENTVISGNSITQCEKGIAMLSFKNDIVSGNSIDIDNDFSQNEKYGIWLSRLSGDTGTNQNITISGNNLNIKGNNYGIYAAIDLYTAGVMVVSQGNYIKTYRTSSEETEDIALGIKRSRRWYGVADGVTTGVRNCFQADIYAVLAFNKAAVTIPANSYVDYLDLNDEPYNFIAANNSIKVIINRDLPGILVCPIVTAGGMKIRLFNVTGTDFSLGSTSNNNVIFEGLESNKMF